MCTACLFAQYIAESGTKEPGYLKELYVTESHTQRAAVFAAPACAGTVAAAAGNGKKIKIK